MDCYVSVLGQVTFFITIDVFVQLVYFYINKLGKSSCIGFLGFGRLSQLVGRLTID
jgi:hypothetical protein